MKHILHIVSVYFSLSYFIGDQFQYFGNKGYKMFVICSPSKELEEYSKKQKFQYKEIEILRKISILKDLLAIKKIYVYIKKNKIDIVTGHSPKGALLSMIAAYLARVPKRIYFRHGLVYETSHGIKRYLLKFIDRITALCSTKVVCVSPSLYKKSIDDHLWSKNKQIILSKGTCNGINIQKFEKENIDISKKDDLREKLNVPKNILIIGFVGRLVRDKGIIELVEAFQLLSKKRNDIYLLLVGMFEKRDALPNEVKNEIINNPHIIYTDYVDNSQIEYYYSLMDLFILPSYREGFPTSILEASAMKLPVITTRVTGCIDAIIASTTGIFIDHDANEIFKSLDLLLDDKKERLRLGENGRLFVEENFEQIIIWREIEKLYQDE
ncbi:MAG: glycosyltransferase family 4 protein [Bacteroidaceae bacterium]|nr:glycosyltransferase family 4 protein [Bacteroidaceae bacterium]